MTVQVLIIAGYLVAVLALGLLARRRTGPRPRELLSCQPHHRPGFVLLLFVLMAAMLWETRQTARVDEPVHIGNSHSRRRECERKSQREFQDAVM